MRPFILADNQYITRRGMASLLERLSIADAIVEASSRIALIERLAVYPNAVTVLDYTLFDFSDAQLMNVMQRYPQSLWLLFSDDLSRHFLRRVLLSGQALSVVMKTDPRDDIIRALTQAARGETCLCELAKQVLRDDVPAQGEYAPLTVSERLILHEMALGKTTKEIACEQRLSFHTINAHRRNIFRKLEINNVHEAVKYALRAGIIDLSEYYI